MHVRMMAQLDRTYRWPAKRRLGDELADARRHRDLLQLLVQKDLKVKYKGTALGFIWSLLNPLLMMLVYTVVFSVLVRFEIKRYPVFLLSGLLPWNAFAAATTAATTSLVTNANLVRRVRFPLEFLPVTSVLSTLINLILSLGILVVFALAYRQPLGWPLLALPVLLLLQAVLTTGIALSLAALLVYFRDIEYLVGVVLMAYFFLTPIIYPLSILNGKRIAFFIELNPMTWLITSYQHVWHDNTWPDPIQLSAFAIFAFMALIVGRLVFRRLQRRFAEEV
jgi:lipopolysaccharide transport system permease protein